MEGIPANLLIPFGAIAAALIAGFFSFLNLVISKEQKVSEFRQAWIDSLRKDVSQYVASITYLAAANDIWIQQERPNVLQHYESMRPSFVEAAQAFTSIILRLNPSDGNKEIQQKTQDFLTIMNEVRDAVRNEDYKGAKPLADSLNKKIQPILKHEWERVKKGEAIYRFTKAVAILIIVSGLLTASLFAYRAYVHVPDNVAAPPEQIGK